MRTTHVSRRTFLGGAALILAGPGAGASRRILAADAGVKPSVRFGLIADLHFADKATVGTRHYRQSMPKLVEAVEALNERASSFAVELGDFIDAAPSVEQELQWLRAIDGRFSKLDGERHYVLGNHCVATLTKEAFIAATAATAPHYAFDEGGVHFVVLDACYRADGTAYAAGNFTWTDTAIHPEELRWLEADLGRTTLPTIVFVHQRLDAAAPDAYRVANAADVRSVLERCGRVLAVFMGHSHANMHAEVGGIHYCVHRAMVEGAGRADSGYAIVDVMADASLRLHGFRAQDSYVWKRCAGSSRSTD